MVKVLDRESINRMTGNSSSGGGGGGGSVDIDLSGYATMNWTEENYINKEFFSSLFKAYDANGNEVKPNDTATTIDNIKAMFGFWTDFYISALGRGQGGGSLVLNQPLSDINAAGLGVPTQANVGIVWNGTRWVYGNTGAGSVAWSAITNKPTTIAGFGITDAKFGTVGADYVPITLGGSTYNVLNRHQSLSGYATESWVNTQISDMATQTWVGQNYLSKTDAASTYLSIAFFNRLFKAYNGTTQVNPNNTTTAIDNIKAMFGFWTDFYISALGTGGQQSVDLRLAQLADVNVAGVTNGQVLTYDSTSGKWIASNPQSGTDMATVWANLAANGNQQINVSHLTTALTGYARTSQIPTDYWKTGETRTANSVLAAPDGNNGAATFRHLASADVYTHSSSNAINNDGTEILTSYNSAEGFANVTYGARIYRRPVSSLWAYIDGKVSANYLGINATAAAASKLTTVSKTAWGQTYWTSGGVPTDISGNMTDVGSIAASGNISITRTTTTASKFVATNSRGSVSLMTSTNRGVYDDDNSKWLIATNGTNTWMNCGNVAIDSSANTTYKLWVNGTIGTNDDVTMYNNKGLMLRDTGGTAHEAVKMSTSDNLRIGYGTRAAGSTVIYGTSIYFRHAASGSSAAMFIDSSGYIGMGTTSPSHKLHVDGGIYSTSYITALSDVRHKNVLGDTWLTVEQIAAAPAIRFTWKDRDDQSIFAGSIAQYWQKVLPEVVQSQADDTLSLDYQVAALISSITVAREVVSLQKKVNSLEKRLLKLEKMFAINNNDIED